MAKAKRGLRFYHAKWLDEDYKPALCQVTRIANGVVYWRQVHTHDAGEMLSGAMYTPAEKFSESVLRLA